MPAHTRTHHTKRKIKIIERTDTISWREAAKRDIRKHSEGGQILRGSRFKKDVAQKELANAIGIVQHHISEMEKDPLVKKWQSVLLSFSMLIIASFSRSRELLSTWQKIAPNLPPFPYFRARSTLLT